MSFEPAAINALFASSIDIWAAPVDCAPANACPDENNVFPYSPIADCDDGFTLNLAFESGKTAVVEVGTSNFIALPKWYIAGTEGAAIIEDWEMNGRLEVMPKKDEADAKPIVAGAGLTKTMAPRLEGEVLVKELPIVKSTILDFYNNVIDVLEDKATPAIKNSEVMRVMKLIEAAFESHETGTVVYFE